MRSRIAEQWKSFEEIVIDARAGTIQRTEMRRAFFAGAIAIFNAVALDMSPGSDTVTNEDEQILKDLAQEIKEYERDLRKHRV